MKRLCTLFLLLILLPVYMSYAQADGPVSLLLDDSRLLTNDESAVIQEQLDQFTLYTGVSIAIITTDKNTNEPFVHAEESYRKQVPGVYGSQHGVSLYINMQTRDINVLAHDDMRSIITISDTDWMWPLIGSHLTNEDYMEACLDFIRYCTDIMTAYYQQQEAEANRPKPVGSGPIFDIAEYLSVAESAAVEASLRTFKNEYGMDAIFITVNTPVTSYWSLAYEFMTFYQNDNMNYNGIAFVVNTYSSSIEADVIIWNYKVSYSWMSEMSQYFDQSMNHGDNIALTIDSIYDRMMAEIEYQNRLTTKIVVYFQDNGSHMIVTILVVVAIGMLILSLINKAGIRKNPPSLTAYIPPGSFHLTSKQDDFLRTRTSRTERPQQSNHSSGGGGGGSFSSGGSSGGSSGSGGKF